jgi:LuxR family maltose regulon positive regulatory protein
LALSLDGQLDQSTQVMLHSKDLAERASNVFLLAQAYHGLALNQYHRGQLRAAEVTARHLVELTGASLRDSSPDQPLPIAAAGFLLLANIYLDRNKLGEMEQTVDQALDLCRRSGGAKSLVEAYVMQSRLRQAQGNLERAYQSFEKAKGAYHLKASQVTRFRLDTQKAHLDLASGALDEVIHWISELGRVNSATESVEPLPTMLHEVLQLILARVHLVKKQPQETIALLEQIQKPAEAGGHYRHLTEIYTLKALAFQAHNENQSSLECLEQAMKLAEAAGIVRVFLDGFYLENGIPMEDLLYKAAEHGIMPEFTKKLLAAYPKILTETEEPGFGLVESLSGREIEVLEQLAKGKNNRQIARELVISLDTVKTHTGNIYSKLGVHNRTQAVIKAQALGLIGN